MKCFFCETKFSDSAALLFGPPEGDLPLVSKFDICEDCFIFLIEFRPTPKTWRDQYESP